MKKIILLVVTILVSLNAYSQKHNELFNGYLSNFTQTAQGTVVENSITYNTYSFIGSFNNDLSQFEGADIANVTAPLFIAVESDGRIYELKITTATAGSIVTGTAIDYSGELSSLPAGNAALYLKTPNKNYPASISGIPESMKEAIDNHFKLMLDSEIPITELALDELTDVTISNLQPNQVLQFNGINWINNSLSTLGGLSGITGSNGIVAADNGDGTFNVKIGGALSENTTILGEDYNLTLSNLGNTYITGNSFQFYGNNRDEFDNGGIASIHAAYTGNILLYSSGNGTGVRNGIARLYLEGSGGGIELFNTVKEPTVAPFTKNITRGLFSPWQEEAIALRAEDNVTGNYSSIVLGADYLRIITPVEPNIGDVLTVTNTNGTVAFQAPTGGSGGGLTGFNAVNGLTDDDNLTNPTVKLGGELIENTTVYGNYDLELKSTFPVVGGNNINNKILLNPGADSENIRLEAYNEFGTLYTLLGLSPTGIIVSTPFVGDGTAQNNDVLKLIDATTGEVEYGRIGITELSGVTISDPQTNQILTYNGTSWVNLTPPSGGISLTNLSAVTNTPGVTSLAYDNTTGVFTYTPQDLSSYLTSEVDGSVTNEGVLSSSTLISGSSVKINSNTPTTDNFVAISTGTGLAISTSNNNITINNTAQDRTVSLTGTGTTTVTGTYPDFTINSESALGDLTNVNVATAIAGEVLKFDGTNWVNSTDNTGSAGGGVASVTVVNGLQLSSTSTPEDVRIELGGALSKNTLITDIGAFEYKIQLDGNIVFETPSLVLGNVNAPYNTTIFIPSYGLGNKEAADLGTQASTWLAGFSDDGKLIEVNSSILTPAYSLNDITDITITGTPANGQFLVYNTTSGKWENQTITVGATQSLSINEATAELSITDGNTVDLSEAIDEQVNTLITAGTNIVKTYNDVANAMEIKTTDALTAIDAITFDANTTTEVANRLQFNTDHNTLTFGMANATPIRIGQDLGWYVKNQTGTTIAKGVAVMAVGTVGASGKVLVDELVADGSVDAHYFLGVTAESIANGADGFVTSQGHIRGINTNAFPDGTVLYADPANPGGFTATEPTGNNLKLPLAFVINSASNGEISVRADLGASIKDLHDVDITGVTTNSILKYNGTTWVVGTDNVNDADSDPANEGALTIAAGLNNSTIINTTTPTSVGISIVAGTGLGIEEDLVNRRITLSNTDGDLPVSIFGGGITTVTGTYPNFTITSTEVDGSVTNELQELSIDNNILSLSNGINTIDLNSYLDDKTVSITGSGITNVTGTYPNFTIASTEVDGSISNEGSLIAAEGSINTSVITSNTSGSTPITLQVSDGLNISTTGNTITLLNSLPENTTASNGLTKVGTAVALGGTLTGNTTINAGTNQFTVNNSSYIEMQATAGSFGNYNTGGAVVQTNSNGTLDLEGENIVLDSRDGFTKLNGFGIDASPKNYASITTLNYIPILSTTGEIAQVKLFKYESSISTTIDFGNTLQKVVRVDVSSQGSTVNVSLSNAIAGGIYTIHFINGQSKTIDWTDANVLDENGSAKGNYTMVTTGKMFTMYYDGTNYYVK